MDLRTTFFGYDMEIVLKRFEKLNIIMDQIDERKITKDTAIQLYDSIMKQPIKRRFMGLNRKDVEDVFENIRRQLMDYQPRFC